VTGRSLVEKISTDFDVSECDFENPLRRSTSPTRGCCTMQKHYTSTIIYVLDVYFHANKKKQDTIAANFYTLMYNKSFVHKQQIN
jgi:hypothetical protein